VKKWLTSLDPHMRKKNDLLKRAYLATLGRPLHTIRARFVFHHRP